MFERQLVCPRSIVHETAVDGIRAEDGRSERTPTFPWRVCDLPALPPCIPAITRKRILPPAGVASV